MNKKATLTHKQPCTYLKVSASWSWTLPASKFHYVASTFVEDRASIRHRSCEGKVDSGASSRHRMVERHDFRQARSNEGRSSSTCLGNMWSIGRRERQEFLVCSCRFTLLHTLDEISGSDRSRTMKLVKKHIERDLSVGSVPFQVVTMY